MSYPPKFEDIEAWQLARELTRKVNEKGNPEPLNAYGGFSMRKAKDIMTSPVITVHHDTSVLDLAKLLSEHRINGVPVVNDAGNLEGIVTEADLIDQNKKLHIPSVIFFLDSPIFLENPKKLDKELRKMAGTTVEDICTRDVVTVKDETPIDEVASLMAEKRINTIPVMCEGKIVGVVGRGDLVRSIVS